MSRDFEYIKELLNGFFDNEEIKERFGLIEKNGVTGWEIWLQIEFAHFLTKHESKPDWRREESYQYDKRKEKIKLKLRPDFLIRKKGWRKDEYMALEFKQNSQPRACLKNMLTDLEKYRKILQSHSDLRSIWTVGVFKTENIEDTQDNFSTFFIEQDSDYSVRDLTLSKIGDTSYWFVII